MNKTSLRTTLVLAGLFLFSGAFFGESGKVFAVALPNVTSVECGAAPYNGSCEAQYDPNTQEQVAVCTDRKEQGKNRCVATKKVVACASPNTCASNCGNASLYDPTPVSGTCPISGNVCCSPVKGGACESATSPNKCASNCSDTSKYSPTPVSGTCPISGNVCCAPKGGGVGSPGSMSPTAFENPLKFDTVQGFLGQLLTTLQGIIVLLSLVMIVYGAVLYIISGGGKQMETAKGAITAAMIGLAIGIAAPSFLKEIYSILGGAPAIDCSGSTGDALIQCQNAQKTLDSGLTLSEILTHVLNFLLGITGVLSLIMLFIGALTYLTSGGNDHRIDDGKKIVKASLIGIAIAFSAMVIVKQIAHLFV